MNQTHKEENYLKAIFSITGSGAKASVTEIAFTLGIKPSSVLDKLNVLRVKNLITYNKRLGAKLTEKGKTNALDVIRRHRIWEAFLVNKLGFGWAEVHEIAEQLEHVKSDNLIDRIYEAIGSPLFDPHGDPIPDKMGKFPFSDRRPLSRSVPGCVCVVVGVNRHDKDFLNRLSELGITLNKKIEVKEVIPFDNLIVISTSQGSKSYISDKISSHLLVKCNKTGCGCRKTL